MDNTIIKELNRVRVALHRAKKGDEYKEHAAAYSRSKYKNMTPEEMDKYRERERRRYHRMSDEEKRRRVERAKKRRAMERAKKNMPVNVRAAGYTKRIVDVDRVLGMLDKVPATATSVCQQKFYASNDRTDIAYLPMRVIDRAASCLLVIDTGPHQLLISTYGRSMRDHAQERAADHNARVYVHAQKSRR